MFVVSFQCPPGGVGTLMWAKGGVLEVCFLGRLREAGLGVVRDLWLSLSFVTFFSFSSLSSFLSHKGVWYLQYVLDRSLSLNVMSGFF